MNQLPKGFDIITNPNYDPEAPVVLKAVDEQMIEMRGYSDWPEALELFNWLQQNKKG